MAYDIKFREKVLEHMKLNKQLPEEVAELFSVGASTVRRWLKNINPKVFEKKPWKIDMDALKEDVKQYPDAYQYERAERLGVGQNCICNALKRLKISYKKKSHSSEGGRREAYFISEED